MSDITFFHNPMSRGQIARWALEEVGAPYETVMVDWQDKPQALLAANSMGKIPTIIHHSASGDLVVSEAPAICHYLAEIYPDVGLLPDGAEKAAYFRWLFFAAGPLEHAVTSTAMGWQVPADREMMAGFGNFDRTIEALDGWLQSHDYVCGERFTMADVYVGSGVDWGLAFNTIPERPSFVEYAERLRARPAYRKAKDIDNALIAAAQS